ncbi:MAG: YHS domain-containing protein, partial [Candidatus Omnitrophota bacterium]
MPKDPICGMEIDIVSAIKVIKDGRDYFFCSSQCKDAFLKQIDLENIEIHYPKIKKPFFKNKLFIIISICLLVITTSYFIPFLEVFRNNFLAYFNKIWWAITLGLFLGGIIDYYIPREYISKILSRNKPSTIF